MYWMLLANQVCLLIEILQDSLLMRPRFLSLVVMQGDLNKQWNAVSAITSERLKRKIILRLIWLLSLHCHPVDAEIISFCKWKGNSPTDITASRLAPSWLSLVRWFPGQWGKCWFLSVSVILCERSFSISHLNKTFSTLEWEVDSSRSWKGDLKTSLTLCSQYLVWTVQPTESSCSGCFWKTKVELLFWFSENQCMG